MDLATVEYAGGGEFIEKLVYIHSVVDNAKQAIYQLSMAYKHNESNAHSRIQKAHWAFKLLHQLEKLIYCGKHPYALYGMNT